MDTVQNIFHIERAKRRLTTREVGAQIGVSNQTVANSENNLKTMLSVKTDVYKKLCAFYGLDEVKIHDMLVLQIEKEKAARRKAKKAGK